ncbi:MAG: NAD(P)-binding protein, partial [Candidatus Magasanikbacteria bacterium]|nr:NAD(P)-binding protein [Candidatus Magasanikbacteria bacterium]
MLEKIVDTIIIGCGVAGIGCAKQLTKNKRDFLIITENIGGRIDTSSDAKVNYGAYFVLKNYKHILPFIKKGDKLHPFSVEFHNKHRHSYHLIKIFCRPFEGWRLLRLLYKFKSEYEKFKKLCETISQKNVIENSHYLKNLYKQKASEFVKKEYFENLAKQFLSEGTYMCTFLPLSKISAFDFMRLCLALILPAYEFTFLTDAAIREFKDKIITDSVENIKTGTFFEIQTKTGLKYRALNLIVATPPNIAQKLLGLKNLKSPSNAYVFHIEGKIKRNWDGGQYELFDSESPVIFIRKQQD